MKPDSTIISLSKNELQERLHQLDLLEQDERILSTHPAGEGNMNFTLRVRTNIRSIIVKQSVPYVAKYPDINAPEDRILKELHFYKSVAFHTSLASSMPTVIGSSEANRIAVFEDCGNAPDLTVAYENPDLMTDAKLATLAHWLAELHRMHIPEHSLQDFDNSEMLQLNHFHIFQYPLDVNNGFDLEAVCPGLTEPARHLQNNDAFKRITHTIGETIYLKNGQTLIHGDFFPGSILDTPDGLKIIDPEFTNCGRPEFDVGVFLAHLYICKNEDVFAERFLKTYSSVFHIDRLLTKQIAGIEIMRRIIGVAQLPHKISLEQRTALLEKAKLLVLSSER